MAAPLGKHLEEAMLVILTPVNNEAIQKASAFLNKSSKQTQAVMPLHALLKHSNPGVRQLAAIFLRKVIQRHWSKLGNKPQQEFRASLLAVLMNEPVRDCRNGLCELISRVAKFGPWPDLLKFIGGAANAPDPGYREVAFKLLSSMSDTVGKFLKDSFPQLQPMLLKGLQDPDARVRVRALRAVNGISEFLETEKEAKLLHGLIEPCIKVTANCVETENATDVISALELFNELLQIQEMDKAIAGYVPQLVQFMTPLVAARNADMHVRDQALTFIQNVAISRCKQFVAHKWLEPLLQVFVAMFSEPIDPEETAEDVTSQRLAVSAIDVFCTALPQKYIGPRVLAMALQLSKSQNWMERKASLEVLAVASQGCFVFMQDHVMDYLPALMAGFKDPRFEVRESACVALAHFSEKLGDAILPHHAVLVPLLVLAMRDSESVAMRALYALQFFSEGLQDAFTPYADGFMTACLSFAQTGSPMLRETACGAIGSIAVALQGQFVKYLGPVVAMLKAFMALTHEDALEVRARATEVAGSVAASVGRAALGPALEEFAALAFASFQDTSVHQFELRQHAYGFFANLADVLKLDFVTLLPSLAPVVTASLMSEEGIVSRSRTEASGLAALVDDDEDDDDDGDEAPALDEDGNPTYGAPQVGEKMNVSVRVPFLEEKKMAIVLVAKMGRVLGKLFAPHVEKLLPQMIELCGFMHSGVRENAARALPDLLHVVSDAFPAPHGKWERGKFNNERPLSRQVINVLKPVCVTLLDVVKEDRDLEVVICAVEALECIIKEHGPGAMEPHIEPIMQSLGAIFAKQSFCQALREQFDEDDRDLELFNVAVDLVSALCAAAGPTPYGLEIARRVAPAYRKMAHKDQPDTYRALALGGMGEITVHIEGAIAPLAGDLLRVALETMSAEDTVTRRNAMYCAGALMQFGGAQVAGAVPNVMTAVRTFYGGPGAPELDPAGRDNAAGALARILLSGIEPLPVAEIFQGISLGLPLLADSEPYAPIYHAYTKAVRSPALVPLLAPTLGTVVQAAVFALVDTKLKLIDKARASLEVFMRVMGMTPEHKQLVLNAIAALPPAATLELRTKLGLV